MMSVANKSKSTPDRTQLIKWADDTNTDPDKCMSESKNALTLQSGK